ATEVAAQVTATLGAILEATPTRTILNTATPGPTQPPTSTPAPTETPTPIPGAVTLTGVRHEYEQWNNCGPVTIGMQLSFWGWQGNQSVTAPVLKPNPRDKNVGPTELVDYVREHTEFEAIYRVGGDLALLKALVAAGFPVIVEKTLDIVGVDGWIGHYTLVTGYNDEQGRFIAQDSYVQSDFPEPYDKLEEAWRSFNFTFIVTYPPEREAEVRAILGPLADWEAANRIALERAEAEIAGLSGQALYFAWFNKGSSLVGLGDHGGAAAAYDAAFGLFAALDSADRPWRMIWYQHGPYIAYMQTGRYQDVIDLANSALVAMGEQTVEETFFWRGLAKEQLGDLDGAIADLRQAVELNTNYDEAVEELERMGE
ncbi:MAG TPA: C39 family peptidase, partial [Anaerolineales bacterium]|nr:C39 family peptidase [Anaerolineales bacterium]